MRSAALLLLLTGCFAPRKTEPLISAVRSGNVERVRELIAKGADVNAPAGVNRWPPLMHAVHKNQIKTAAALLDGGANVNDAGKGGETPLMMAAAYDNKEMTALLLAHGADPSIKEPSGNTALDLAITGVRDIDRFTWFRCNESTAAMLKKVSPPPRAGTMKWAKLKGCA